MSLLFAIRSEERDDTRAMAIVKVAMIKNGLTFDDRGRVTDRRNGGLWQYEIPVREEVLL